MSEKYDDIINLPHHTSASRPHMSLYDRAAQFSPFAALTGYEEAVCEAGRLTDIKFELTDEQVEQINKMINYIQENIKNCPEILLTYFKKDSRKIGGEYITVRCVIKRVNEYEKSIVTTDGKEIFIEDIFSISLFESDS